MLLYTNTIPGWFAYVFSKLFEIFNVVIPGFSISITGIWIVLFVLSFFFVTRSVKIGVSRGFGNATSSKTTKNSSKGGND